MTEKEGFIIESDGKADWVLQQIQELNKKVMIKNNLADERLSQIENWREEEVKKLQDSIEWFETALHTYAMRLKREDKDLKTHSLPFGKLQFRSQSPKYRYNDTELVEFLIDEKYEDYIKIKKSADKKALKKKLQIKGGKAYLQGLEVRGIEVEEREESFIIKVVD